MAQLPDINDSIEVYEKWLCQQPNADDSTIKKKAKKIREGGAFALLRATFHRWVERWAAARKNLLGTKAPVVLAVGDLHADNFGTWHDVHRRRVWGVNDFDEACDLPFTSDLVRLAVSIALVREESVDAVASERSAALLEGYRGHLSTNGSPIFPDAVGCEALHELLVPASEDDFWDKMADESDFEPRDRPELETKQPGVAACFAAILPTERERRYFRVKKAVGLGSLGRRRYRMVVDPDGERRCFEAKALVPSASALLDPKARQQSLTGEMLRRAIRSPDAVLRVREAAPERWLVREVGPEFLKIEIGDLAEKAPALLARHQHALFRWMGAETANIHLGSATRDTLLEALDRLPTDWLENDAALLEEGMREDWDAWKKANPKKDS